MIVTVSRSAFIVVLKLAETSNFENNCLSLSHSSRHIVATEVRAFMSQGRED